MKRLKGFLFFLFAFGITSDINCQQVFILSQNTFNKYIYNPAVAGTDSFPVLNLSYRQLWSGLNDSPKEELISIHMPLFDNGGLGSKVYSVVTGPISKTAFEATYAHRVPLSFGDYTLSLGLSVLLYQYSIDKNKITLENPDDNALLKSSSNLIVPDANFGAYMYNKKWYFSLAVHQLFNRRVSMLNKINLKQRQVRHYFLNAGNKFSVNDFLDMEPSAGIKFIETGVFQADLNLLCSYRKMISLGIGYRTKDAITLLSNTKYKRASFGYSYDITLSTIKKFSSGSHEIMITYRFKS